MFLSSGRAILGAFLVGVGVILIVYVQMIYVFAPLLAVDYGLDFWPAMEFSRRTIQSRFFEFFGFFLILALINLAGALFLFVGLVVTIPLLWISITAAYGDIFGFQANEYRESSRQVR